MSTVSAVYPFIFTMATSSRTSKYALMMLYYSFMLAGIFIDEDYREYEKWYVVCFNTFVVVGGSAIFVIFSQVDAVSEKTEVIYALFGAMCVGMVFTTFQLHKGRLREVYCLLEKMYETNEFEKISNRMCVEIVSKYKMYVIYMVAITFTVPVVTAAITDVSLGDLRTLIIPSWYPWSRFTVVGYTVTIIAQMFTMLAAYSLLVSAVAFISTTVIAIYTNYEILLERLSSLDICTNGDDTDDSYWYGEMKALIEHHRHLMNNEVVKLAATFISVLLFTVIGEVVALITVFIQVKEDYLYKLKLLSACSIMMWAFVSYCVAGEILVNLKDQIKIALYKTPWYCQNMKKRKTILTFLILNKNPLTLKAFNMYHINLPFSLSFARIIYSVVQFLQTKLIK